MLAILAKQTFQLLCDNVAKCGVHVANHNFWLKVVQLQRSFQWLEHRKECSMPPQQRKLHGYTVQLLLFVAELNKRLADHANTNATSVHKSAAASQNFHFCLRMGSIPHKTGGLRAFGLVLTPAFGSGWHRLSGANVTVLASGLGNWRISSALSLACELHFGAKSSAWVGVRRFCRCERVAGRRAGNASRAAVAAERQAGAAMTAGVLLVTIWVHDLWCSILGRCK